MVTIENTDKQAFRILIVGSKTDMKRKLFFSCLFILGIGHTMVGCLATQTFPKGAIIIEQQTLPSTPDRAIVLWMINPRRSDPIPGDEPYTCPDATRGSAYSGPTRVSLLKMPEGNIINTIKIRDPHFPEKDTFDIPYEIRPGYYYMVKSVAPSKASKPTILNFQDLNGDGEAAEFVLYDAPFCMGLQTTLVGYSRHQDRVLQYPLDVEFKGDKKTWRETSVWLEYIFSEKPIAPGHYRFKVDYRGRGGWLVAYDITYDPTLERFRGMCDVTEK